MFVLYLHCLLLFTTIVYDFWKLCSLSQQLRAGRLLSYYTWSLILSPPIFLPFALRYFFLYSYYTSCRFQTKTSNVSYVHCFIFCFSWRNCQERLWATFYFCQLFVYFPKLISEAYASLTCEYNNCGRRTTIFLTKIMVNLWSSGNAKLPRLCLMVTLIVSHSNQFVYPFADAEGVMYFLITIHLCAFKIVAGSHAMTGGRNESSIFLALGANYFRNITAAWTGACQ